MRQNNSFVVLAFLLLLAGFSNAMLFDTVRNYYISIDDSNYEVFNTNYYSSISDENFYKFFFPAQQLAFDSNFLSAWNSYFDSNLLLKKDNNGFWWNKITDFNSVVTHARAGSNMTVSCSGSDQNGDCLFSSTGGSSGGFDGNAYSLGLLSDQNIWLQDFNNFSHGMTTKRLQVGINDALGEDGNLIVYGTSTFGFEFPVGSDSPNLILLENNTPDGRLFIGTGGMSFNSTNTATIPYTFNVGNGSYSFNFQTPSEIPAFFGANVEIGFDLNVDRNIFVSGNINAGHFLEADGNYLCASGVCYFIPDLNIQGSGGGYQFDLNAFDSNFNLQWQGFDGNWLKDWNAVSVEWGKVVNAPAIPVLSLPWGDANIANSGKWNFAYNSIITIDANRLAAIQASMAIINPTIDANALLRANTAEQHANVALDGNKTKFIQDFNALRTDINREFQGKADLNAQWEGIANHNRDINIVRVDFPIIGYSFTKANFDNNFFTVFKVQFDNNFFTMFKLQFDNNFFIAFKTQFDNNYFTKFKTDFDNNYYNRFANSFDNNYLLKKDVNFTKANFDSNQFVTFKPLFDSNFKPAFDNNIFTYMNADKNKAYLLQFLEGWTDSNSWQNIFTQFNNDGNFVKKAIFNAAWPVSDANIPSTIVRTAIFNSAFPISDANVPSTITRTGIFNNSGWKDGNFNSRFYSAFTAVGDGNYVKKALFNAMFPITDANVPSTILRTAIFNAAFPISDGNAPSTLVRTAIFNSAFPMLDANVPSTIVRTGIFNNSTWFDTNFDWQINNHSISKLSFTNIAVSGQSNAVADSNNDTLTLTAGTNVTITTNASTDTITINSTATNGSSSTGWDGIYGDGSDGNVVISSGITTLSRDMYYHDLNVNAGAILDPSGFKIFVNGVLGIAATGKIDANGGNGGPGGNGGNASAGAGGSAGSAGSAGPVADAGGTLPAPLAGVAGSLGGAGVVGAPPTSGNNGVIGNNGNAQTSALRGTSTGTAASAGGNGGEGLPAAGGGPGTPGARTALAAASGDMRNSTQATMWAVINNAGTVLIPKGGSGAASGGGGGSGSIASDASLAGNTLISTPEGSIRIKDLKKGSKVYSWSEKENKIVIDEITAVEVHIIKKPIKHFIINEALNATFNHVIFTGRGWLPAQEIIKGDWLLEIKQSKKALSIGKIKVESIKAYYSAETVYDLEIKESHNFFADKILVHNVADSTGGGGGSGGSGANGGYIFIAAQTIINSGSIDAYGGSGGPGGNGGAPISGCLQKCGGSGGGAGGSGGPGGVIVIISNTPAGSLGIITVIGGSPGVKGVHSDGTGTGAAPGVDGSDGLTGPTGLIIYISGQT